MIFLYKALHAFFSAGPARRPENVFCIFNVFKLCCECLRDSFLFFRNVIYIKNKQLLFVDIDIVVCVVNVDSTVRIQYNIYNIIKCFLQVNACKFTTTYVNAKFILSICM